MMENTCITCNLTMLLSALVSICVLGFERIIIWEVWEVSKYESVKFGRIQFLQINYRLILKGCCTRLQSSRYTLYDAKTRHPNQFSCVYLNINSFGYKFCSVKELLTTNTVDMLIIAEAKLGNTFINSQFAVDNYHLWRAGRNLSSSKT
jgi:hypothetical protein